MKLTEQRARYITLIALALDLIALVIFIWVITVNEMYAYKSYYFDDQNYLGYLILAAIGVIIILSVYKKTLFLIFTGIILMISMLAAAICTAGLLLTGFDIDFAIPAIISIPAILSIAFYYITIRKLNRELP